MVFIQLKMFNVPADYLMTIDFHIFFSQVFSFTFFFKPHHCKQSSNAVSQNQEYSRQNKQTFYSMKRLVSILLASYISCHTIYETSEFTTGKYKQRALATLVLLAAGSIITLAAFSIYQFFSSSSFCTLLYVYASFDLSLYVCVSELMLKILTTYVEWGFYNSVLVHMSKEKTEGRQIRDEVSNQMLVAL